MVFVYDESVAFDAKSGIRLESGIDSSYGGPDERQEGVAEGDEEVWLVGLGRHYGVRQVWGSEKGRALDGIGDRD